MNLLSCRIYMPFPFNPMFRSQRCFIFIPRLPGGISKSLKAFVLPACSEGKHPIPFPYCFTNFASTACVVLRVQNSESTQISLGTWNTKFLALANKHFIQVFFFFFSQLPEASLLIGQFAVLCARHWTTVECLLITLMYYFLLLLLFSIMKLQ